MNKATIKPGNIHICMANSYKNGIVNEQGSIAPPSSFAISRLMNENTLMNCAKIGGH